MRSRSTPAPDAADVWNVRLAPEAAGRSALPTELDTSSRCLRLARGSAGSPKMFPPPSNCTLPGVLTRTVLSRPPRLKSTLGRGLRPRRMPCRPTWFDMHRCRGGHIYPPALFNKFFEVSPIGPFARTSNVRAPSSGGIGSSHGAAIIVSCASERPCAHRVSIVGRSNS